MSSLLVLVPMGVAFAALASVFLIVAVRGGQFENLQELGRRMPDDEA